LVTTVDAHVRAPAIALRNVAVTFRLADGVTYPAIRSTSLAVADGEFVAIVGPTGCGKSTLLNIAAGLIAPSAGEVDIFGTRLAGLNRQAGYLFQADALFPWKSALENVAVGLETAGAARKQARARAQSWLNRVDWPSFPGAIRTCFRAARGSASVLRRSSSAIRKFC
jgi:NitT/TauT family transport system ATP-binding protein